MYIMRYSVGQGYFCSVSIYKLHLKKPWRLCWGYVVAVLWQ